jgi:hypothetical protein
MARGWSTPAGPACGPHSRLYTLVFSAGEVTGPVCAAARRAGCNCKWELQPFNFGDGGTAWERVWFKAGDMAHLTAR